MEDLIKNEDLIIVKQLPVIEDRLMERYKEVQERLAVAAGLAVTEENYKEIKKLRADLNKEFNDLESGRKKVKAAIEAPYKSFESGAYKTLADAYKAAVAKLDGEIKDVEGTLKNDKRRELLAYWEEYRQSLSLDSELADPARSGIKVGLTGSMKSYKQQARDYLDKIDGDLKMIATLDNSDEVMAEYRQNLNVTDAVRAVAERQKRIAEEKVRREAEAAERAAKVEHDARVEAALAAPEVEAVEEEVSLDEAEQAVEKEEILKANYLGFEIFGTLEQLKALKSYLKDCLKSYMNMEGLKYNG